MVADVYTNMLPLLLLAVGLYKTRLTALKIEYYIKVNDWF